MKGPSETKFFARTLSAEKGLKESRIAGRPQADLPFGSGTGKTGIHRYVHCNH